VVFTSDNGGSTAENNDTQYPADGYAAGRLTGSNRPLRGGKGELYEGGIRVATIAHWPGRLQAGKCDVPVHIVDWMPTLTRLGGFRPETDYKWDGADVWPQISGANRERPARPLYWVTPRAKAVRDGDWKLIVQPARGEAKAKTELFNVAADPNETAELAAGQPAKVAELMARMTALAVRDRDAEAKD
jgi:arylsulfatase A-like enzyme